MNRRTKAQWRGLISQQQLSGLSAAEFCRGESVNPKYFKKLVGRHSVQGGTENNVRKSAALP